MALSIYGGYFMTARITLEIATERVNNFYNGNIKILEYKGIRDSVITQCNICGNVWTSQARNLINGKGYCPACSNPNKKHKTKFSLESVIKYLNERNCELYGESPKNTHDNMGIKYPCGHINYLPFSTFKKNFGCKKCKQNTFYVNRYSKDDLLNIINDNGFEFVDFPDDFVDGSSIISYKCKENHITNRMIKNFIKFPTCKTCSIIKRALANRGDGSSAWKGGVSKIWDAARHRLDPWTISTLRECNYSCQITGQTNVPIDVHHITSFNIIAHEAMAEFGIYDEHLYLKTYQEYGEKVILRIVELHNKYGNGVCLRKDIHVLYHKLYGHGNNTPAQFEEFKQRIASGEISLPE